MITVQKKITSKYITKTYIIYLIYLSGSTVTIIIIVWNCHLFSRVTDTTKNENANSNYDAEQLYYADQQNDTQQNDNILSKNEEKGKNFNTKNNITDILSFTVTIGQLQTITITKKILD